MHDTQRDEACRLRDEGIDTAAAHADAVQPEWTEQAFAFLRLYLELNATFTTEDVRMAARGVVPEPPDRRAWGSVTRRAVKEKLIERSGFTEAKDPRVHCNIVAVWRSKVVAS